MLNTVSYLTLLRLPPSNSPVALTSSLTFCEASWSISLIIESLSFTARCISSDRLASTSRRLLPTRSGSIWSASSSASISPVVRFLFSKEEGGAETINIGVDLEEGLATLFLNLVWANCNVERSRSAKEGETGDELETKVKTVGYTNLKNGSNKIEYRLTPKYTINI